MITVSEGGILVVCAAAVLLAVRQGPGTGRYFLIGAAAWIAAQIVKGVLAAPVELLFVHPGADAAESARKLTSAWAYMGYATVLAAVVEAFTKYVPLKWLGVRRYGEALALGLGAGVIEALAVVATLLAHGTGAPGLLGALIPVWERLWAVSAHAAFAAVVAIAVVRREGRWLALACALHFVTDLPAGIYQREVAIGAAEGSVPAALAASEITVAAVAVAAWLIGRRLWAAMEAAAANVPPVSGSPRPRTG